MYAAEQSDRPIVPRKPPNKGLAVTQRVIRDRRRWGREGA
jgi:hypothetical protein